MLRDLKNTIIIQIDCVRSYMFYIQPIDFKGLLTVRKTIVYVNGNKPYEHVIVFLVGRSYFSTPDKT